MNRLSLYCASGRDGDLKVGHENATHSSACSRSRLADLTHTNEVDVAAMRDVLASECPTPVCPPAMLNSAVDNGWVVAPTFMLNVVDLPDDLEPALQPLRDLFAVRLPPRKPGPHVYEHSGAHTTKLRSQTSSALSGMHVDYADNLTCDAKEQT